MSSEVLLESVRAPRKILHVIPLSPERCPTGGKDGWSIHLGKLEVKQRRQVLSSVLQAFSDPPQALCTVNVQEAAQVCKYVPFSLNRLYLWG